MITLQISESITKMAKPQHVHMIIIHHVHLFCSLFSLTNWNVRFPLCWNHCRWLTGAQFTVRHNLTKTATTSCTEDVFSCKVLVEDAAGKTCVYTGKWFEWLDHSSSSWRFTHLCLMWLSWKLESWFQRPKHFTTTSHPVKWNTKPKLRDSSTAVTLLCVAILWLPLLFSSWPLQAERFWQWTPLTQQPVKKKEEKKKSQQKLWCLIGKIKNQFTIIWNWMNNF